MISEVLDLVFPAPCLVCGKKPKPLCQECEPVFGVFETSEVDFYAAALDENLGGLTAALKDRNRTALFSPLGNGLRPCLIAAIEKTKPTLLVCPPSSKRNFRKRGFNPALQLAQVANVSNLPCTDRALGLTREPKDQRHLDSFDRERNVAGLFKSRITSGRVLLVDDVRTTGATLQSARFALEGAGVQVVGSCVLAQRI